MTPRFFSTTVACWPTDKEVDQGADPTAPVTWTEAVFDLAAVVLVYAGRHVGTVVEMPDTRLTVSAPLADVVAAWRAYAEGPSYLYRRP